MNLRIALFLFTVTFLCLAHLGWLASALVLFVVGNLLGRARKPRLCATISVNEIIQDTLDAFKAMLPPLFSFSFDMSSATARKGDTIYAHIANLPSLQSYDAASGYELNQVEADALITDVPITLNQLSHVPVRVKYLTEIASRKNLYREAISNQAFVLAKGVLDYALGKVTAANFSTNVAMAAPAFSLDGIETIRTRLNTNKAMPTGRFGILGSSGAQYLQTDQRVGSSFFYGQLNGNMGYRVFQNLSGFQNVFEYPDFPSNGQNCYGLFGDRRAIGFATRIPSVQDEIASQLNLPQIASFAVGTEPQTGLSLLAIAWQKQGTFDVWLTMALLYDAVAGAQGGAAGQKTDFAGVRLTTV